MYSLDCSYYKNEFATISELVNAVQISGMDPSYEITRNGVCTGECVIDLMQF